MKFGHNNNRFLQICMLAAVFCLALMPTTAEAHSRSVSYSSWSLEGNRAAVEFRLDSRNVAEIIVGPGLESGSIGPREIEQMREIARELVIRGVVVTQNGQPCTVELADGPARVAQEMLVTEGVFSCAEAIETAGIGIQVNLIPDWGVGHSHLMRVEVGSEQHEVALGGFVSTWSWTGEGGPSFGVWQNIQTFVQTGVVHILSGYDHLAFLFTLMLVVSLAGAQKNLFKEMIVVATSFTIGHSLTLALAVTGTVQPSSETVEFLIALSIAVLAFEGFLVTAKKRAPVRKTYVVTLAVLPVLGLVGFSGQPFWVLLGMAIFAIAYLELMHSTSKPRLVRGSVALFFGLVHGFGFAGILTEMGLSGPSMALSLISFNVGVELGQAFVLTIALLPLLKLRELSSRASITQVGCAITLCLACFWMGARAV